jgi:hypothetical protein
VTLPQGLYQERLWWFSILKLIEPLMFFPVKMPTHQSERY